MKCCGRDAKSVVEYGPYRASEFPALLEAGFAKNSLHVFRQGRCAACNKQLYERQLVKVADGALVPLADRHSIVAEHWAALYAVIIAKLEAKKAVPRMGNTQSEYTNRTAKNPLENQVDYQKQAVRAMRAS